jgi:hypothetical protein
MLMVEKLDPNGGGEGGELIHLVASILKLHQQQQK